MERRIRDERKGGTYDLEGRDDQEEEKWRDAVMEGRV